MSDALDLNVAWSRVLTSLASTDLAPHQMAMLGLTRPLGLVEDTVLVAAPNEFTQNFLESRLRPRLTERLSSELNRDVRIAVTVERPTEGHPRGDTNGAVAHDLTAPPGQTPDQAPDSVADSADGTGPARPDPPGAVEHGAAVDGADGTDVIGGIGYGRPEVADNGTVTDRHSEGNAVEVALPGNVSSLRDHQRRWDFRTDQSRTNTADAASTTPSGDEGSRLSPLPRGRARIHPPARLNPKYTFDSFVIGNSNRFAHAAAFAVAEVRAYNPMFIYGDSGLGKTHLLHAIGHYSEAFFPQHRVNYFTTEEFTNDFINQVHAGRAEEFRRRYRDVDLLLVDDVQFLERAERTQEEFFHTFNTLHSAGKQIVITSDRPPKQLTTLEDRLRTRFGWGLITDVQVPDLETRIAILRKKVAGDVLPEVDPAVLEYIASKIQTNIRELEGALIRVNAYASLNRTDVSIGLAEEVLRDLLPEDQGSKITATIIMSVTAEYFGVTVEDLKGHSRSRVLVGARQIAMFLCRDQTQLSLPRIGQIFGGKDHTTVMHAVRKISALMAERRAIFNQVTELTGRIKARARQ